MTAAFLFFVMLIVGLFLWLAPKMPDKAVKLGEMLVFACVLGMAITLAPAAMTKLLH